MTDLAPGRNSELTAQSTQPAGPAQEQPVAAITPDSTDATRAWPGAPQPDSPETLPTIERRRPDLAWVLFAVCVFLVGLGSGYVLGAIRPTQVAAGGPVIAPPDSPTATHPPELALIDQVNPPQGYTLTVSLGDLGPRLVAAGGIDAQRFAQVYQEAGRPLTAGQQAALVQNSSTPIVINHENAYFLLNFFWAVGLVNENPILTEGPMMAGGRDQVGNFASTGGWTLGTKPATELYASRPLITLTPAQQARLIEVASAVYRPCCDNPTLFPDCNHGMAMLGLLELMAAHDATAEDMFTAAKYVNAFWFPQQTFELATLFQAQKQLSFDQIPARQLVGKAYMSSSGFQAAHQWLVAHNQLPQAPSQGGSCGVN